MLETLTQQVAAGQSLAPEQCHAAVAALAAGAVDVGVKAAFLTALSQKGETPEEIAAFTRALRDKSLPVPLPPGWMGQREVLDIVGTGGDRIGTFNISTTAALLCAAAGVAVAKHGNRAVTSKSGSADVLAALGIAVDLNPEAAARSLVEHGFVFLFAPKFHPAFEHIGPARKRCAERGQRTIFNLLGPLLNPVRPSAMLVGVPRVEYGPVLARVLQSLGVRRGMVVTGELPPAQPGESPRTMDELSSLGRNHVAEFYHERGFATSTLSPEDLPLQPVRVEDLLGGEAAENAAITRAILGGQDRGPRRDAVVLNAAAGLFVAGRVKSLSEGWEVAEVTLDSGAAAAKLAALATVR